MAISFTSDATGDLLVDQRMVQGPTVNSFVAAGLTAGASNVVPHGLPRAPRRVWLMGVGNAAQAAAASLDTSLGLADPTGFRPGGKTGYDATNIYIFPPAGVTAVVVHVEY